jgi:hypothetical protein
LQGWNKKETAALSGLAFHIASPEGGRKMSSLRKFFGVRDYWVAFRSQVNILSACGRKFPVTRLLGLLAMTALWGCGGDDTIDGGNFPGKDTGSADHGGNPGGDGGASEDAGNGSDPWKNWKLVIPGSYSCVSCLNPETEEVSFWNYEPPAMQEEGIKCNGLWAKGFSPLGAICLATDSSLSLCKNDTKCQEVIGATATGQVYLCDCNALGEQFGTEIQTWCGGFNHLQENCGSGGVRVEFCEANTCYPPEDHTIFIYKKAK